jgi:hypothetical protein
VNDLALYNDKGIAWSKHDSQRVEVERQLLLGQIRCLIKDLGEKRISVELLNALENGSLKTDMTGHYIACAKQTKL